MIDTSTRGLSMSFESQPECVLMAAAAVHGVCSNHLGLSEQETYQVELAVVESLSNIVLHAYGGEPGPVSLRMDACGDELTVELTDQGQALSEADMLASRRLPAVDPSNVEILAETGRGLFVVWSLMDEVRYASEGGVNRLTLVRRRGGSPRRRLPEPHWAGSHVQEATSEHSARLAYLLRELEFARQIQCSILPVTSRQAGLDLYAEVRPALHVGGDFFDVVPSPQGLMVVIGDVMGKGLPASLTMVMALTLLRESARHCASPRQLFSEANTRLYERLQSMILWNAVSAAAVHLDPDRRRMRYAKAGHENVLLWRAAERRVEELTGVGYFLGMFEDGEYEEYETHLASGDKVVLFTDGVPNARDLDGACFGIERLVDLVRIHADLDARSLGQRILQALGEHQGPREPTDDVALFILGLTDE